MIMFTAFTTTVWPAKNTVRPHVREFPIGKQGGAFDRNELDQWADAYIEAAAIEKQNDRDNKKIWQEKYLRPALLGFASIRVHDLKHTFGRRLRAAGVTLEDRKALLGHMTILRRKTG